MKMPKDLRKLTDYQIKERERSTRNANDPSKPSMEYKRLTREQHQMLNEWRDERRGRRTGD